MSQELTTMSLLDNQQEPTPEYTQGQRKGWTRGLTIIVCLFLFIGVTGALSGAYGMAELLVSSTTVDEKPPRFNSPAERKAWYRAKEVEEKMLETRAQYWPVLFYIEILKIALAVGFFAAIALIVQRNEKARSFAVIVCGGAIFYHLSVCAVALLFTGHAGGMIGELLQSSVNEAHHLSAEEKEKAVEFMKNATSLGLAIGLSISLLLKGLFYGFIIFYLSQAHIRLMLGENPYKEMDELAANTLPSRAPAT